METLMKNNENKMYIPVLIDFGSSCAVDKYGECP